MQDKVMVYGWGKRVVYFLNRTVKGGFFEEVIFELRFWRLNRSYYLEFQGKEILGRRFSKYKDCKVKTILECVNGGDEVDTSRVRRFVGKVGRWIDRDLLFKV